MIGCIYRGYGMAGLLSYIGGKDEATLLATNLFGAAPRDFLRQIDVVGRLRAKAPAAPVVHLTLRAAGGEDLSDQQWSSAVDYVLQELGYDNSPFMAYLHTHEGGRHLHIATYRVRFDGGLVSDSMDRYRIMAVCRELERRFSLTIATPRRSRRLTRPALEKAVQQPDREVRLAAVRRAISEAAAESFTLRELVTRLHAMGITTHLKVARNTGKLQGVSFELPVSREIIRGSTLGKQFSLANLCNAHNLAVDHAASGPVLVMHGLTNLELRRLRQSLPPDRVVSEGSRQNAYWVLPAAASDFADLVVTRMPHRFVTFAGLDPYLHPTQELLESRQQLALTVRRQLENPSPAASIADDAPALESMLASLDRIRLESSRPEVGHASRAAALGRLAHAVSGELSSPRISEGERAAALVAYHEIVPAAAPEGPLQPFYPQTYAERADRLSLALLREHHSGWSQALLRASSPAQRQALDHVATRLGELCSLAQLSLPLAAVRERLELVQAALRELPSDQLKDSLALVAERRAYQDLLSDHSRHRQPPPASSELSPAWLPVPLIHRLVEDVAKDRADAVTLGGDSPAYAFALAALRELLPESPRHPYVSRASVERLCQSIDYLTEETSTKQFAVALLHHLLERHDEAAAAGPPGYEAPDAISLTLVELHLEAHRRRRDAAPDLAALEASSSSYSALLPLQTDHPLGVPLSAVEAHLEELSRNVETAAETTRPAAVAARRAVLDLLDDHRLQQAPTLGPHAGPDWIPAAFFHHHQAALRAELPFAANPAPTEAALLALRDLTPVSTEAGVHVEVVRRHLASVAVLEPSALDTYGAVRQALEAVIADHARQASPRLDPRGFDPATVANAYQISRALLDQHLRDAEAQLERSPEAAAYLLSARLSALRELAAIERPTLPVEAVYAALTRHDRDFSLATEPLHRSYHLQARSALLSLLQDHSRLTIPRPLDRAPSSFHDPGDQIPSALLRSHLQGYSAQITTHSSLERPNDRFLVHQARLRIETLTPLLPATPEGTVSATLLREQRSLLLEKARHDPDRASDLRGQSDALAAVLYDHQRSYRNDAGARLEASSRALREAEAAYFADPRAETYALWCAHLHHHQNDLTDVRRVENDRRLSGRRTYFAREVRALARYYERRLLLNFTPDYLQLRAEAWLRNKASQFALRPVYRGLSMLPGGSALSSGLSVASQTAQLSYRTYLELRLLRDALRPGALENGNLSTRALLEALRHARLAPAAALPTRPATSLGAAIGGCRTADLALARGVRAFRRDQLDRPRLLALAQNALSARAELTQFTLSQLGVPRLEQLETLLGSRSKALGTWLGSLWEAGLSARSVTQVFIQVAPVVFADKALSLSFVAARALVRHAFSSSMTSAQEALILREQHEQRR